MKKIIALTLSLFSLSKPVFAGDGNKDIVVLLHGIGHSEFNMSGIEHALNKQGFQTLNIGYPSLSKDIEELAAFLETKLEDEKVWSNKNDNIHFVTHSMGGVVVRTFLTRYKKQLNTNKLGRVVMLAPPHGGSEVADLLKNFLPYKWVFGPAGQQLTTEHQQRISSDVYYDLGIIAGDKEWPYIIAAHIIPGESDGRVALEKTKLDGAKDHITLSATHSFISWKPSVHKQIIHFISNGEFMREDQ